MSQALRLAVAQPVTVAHDVATNARAHADAIRTAAARVVVFPELSLTGYEMAAAVVDPADPRLAPVIEACAETGALALVGAPVAGDQGGDYIGMLAVRGTGVEVVYRKLYVDQSEGPRFVSGAQPVALEVDGWRLGLAICKDTGIPAQLADTAALGIDVYAAGVVMHDYEDEILAGRGRAIAADFGVHVAFASFAGSTGAGYDRCAGTSGIWAPDGSVVTRAGADAGAVVVADLPAPSLAAP